MHALEIMQNVPGGEVFLFSSFTGNWVCTAEGKHDNIAFKVRGEGNTPGDALNECYTRWQRVTGQLPELVPSLPSPNTDIPF